MAMLFTRKTVFVMRAISIILIFALFNVATIDLQQHYLYAKTARAQEPAYHLDPDHQRPVELPYYSTGTTKIYGNPDGSFTAVI
jgi:hypothetical protein